MYVLKNVMPEVGWGERARSSDGKVSDPPASGRLTTGGGGTRWSQRADSDTRESPHSRPPALVLSLVWGLLLAPGQGCLSCPAPLSQGRNHTCKAQSSGCLSPPSPPHAALATQDLSHVASLVPPLPGAWATLTPAGLVLTLREDSSRPACGLLTLPDMPRASCAPCHCILTVTPFNRWERAAQTGYSLISGYEVAEQRFKIIISWPRSHVLTGILTLLMPQTTLVSDKAQRTPSWTVVKSIKQNTELY